MLRGKVLGRSVLAAVVLLAACSRKEAGRGGEAAHPAGDAVADSGYVSGVATEDFALTTEEKRALLALARASVETFVRTGKYVEAPPELVRDHPILGKDRACFVTLTVHGQLRGCIGSLEPRRPLVDDVRFNAVSAAEHDSRFEPVTESELPTLSYEVSVLDLPKPLVGVAPADLPAWLGRNKPGLIIEYMGRRSTFLPTVWEDLPDPNAFLAHLCRKQGSPSQCWRDPNAKISTYGSIHFSDEEFR